MATSTLPSRRGGFSRRWWIGGILLVGLVAVIALMVAGEARRSAATAPATVRVTRGDLVARVSGSGSVTAEQTLSLPFQTAGVVTEVLVKEGEAVQAGQVLARLDDRALQLQVASASSALESARARLAQAEKGNARPEDLAAAEAAVAAAQAGYDKATRGPSASDLASAQAAVRSAEAAYQAAVNGAGTSGSQFEAAAANMRKAQVALQQAQAAYDKVAGQPSVGMLPQSAQLQQATIDFEQAKANYESLSRTAGSDARAKVDSAAAQLAQARANLARLTPAAEDIASAQANLDQARANLAKLTASGTANDVQIQKAAVAQAESTLKQAELGLENATLKAPFGGIVSQVNVQIGGNSGPTAPALRLINRNPLHVDLRLSENDVARVQEDQPVRLAIASLANWETDGRVSYVAPAGENVGGLVTYAVRVSFPDRNPQVKVGMTADLSIETARKSDVLLVPSAALLPKGAGHVVQVPDAGTEGGTAETREVEVRIGLSDGSYTEVIDGLQEGQEIVGLPNSGSARRGSGPFGN